MKIVTVANGSLSMYIQPESELDKIILNELFKGPVETRQHQTVQVGGKALVDAIEITPVKPLIEKQSTDTGGEKS